MANFPIEIMVKLTYNIYEVIYMAEFCLECWNKINNSNDKKFKYIMSKYPDLCEECGENKQVIVGLRQYCYINRFRIIKVLYYTFNFMFRLLIFPYFIYIRYKANNKDVKK